MSTELSKPITVVSPITGEILDLDGPLEKLAVLKTEIAEYELYLREMKAAVDGRFLQQMDAHAQWTLSYPGLKVSAPSPAPVEEFDAAALRDDLLDLVDQGSLSIEAVDAAVEVVVSYKARKAGITALRKLPGLAQVIDRHAHEAERRRYVSVKPA